MKKILIAATAAAVLVLSGCKSGVQVPVAFSDLSGASTVRMAKLFLEVPSCQDRETGLESSHLLEAKQQVAFVIKDAKYEQCVKDGFQSLAVFEVPVTIGTGAVATGADLTVQGGNDGNVQFAMSEKARTKLQKITKNAMGFDPDDFEITVWLKNDSGKDLTLFVPSAVVKAKGYADTPIHNGNISQKRDTAFGFVLSNVAARSVLASRGNADAFVVKAMSEK